MTTIHEKLAALPKSAKVVGALVGAAVVSAGGWLALRPKKHRRSKELEGGRPAGAGGGAGQAGSEGAIGPGPGSGYGLARPHGRHPLSVLLVHPPRHSLGSDIAIRHDIARLLEDIRRAKHGEPPLAGAPPGMKEWDHWTYFAILPNDPKLSHTVRASVADADTGAEDAKVLSEVSASASPGTGVIRTRFENQAGGGSRVIVKQSDPPMAGLAEWAAPDPKPTDVKPADAPAEKAS